MIQNNNNDILESKYLSSRQELDKAIINALNEENYLEASDLVSSLHVADLADLIENLSSENRSRLLDIIKIIPELLVEIKSPSIKEDVIEYLSYNKVATLISTLEIDDTFSILVDIKEEIQSEILKHVDPLKKRELKELFSYPENSAGRMMQKKFIALTENITVGETIEKIQNMDNTPSEFYEIFIVDNKFKPIAYVSLGSLMTHKKNVLLSDIKKSEMKIINTNIDQEEVSFLFKHYGLISAPVVNKIGRLVGIITVEDAVEIIGKEAEEDIMYMGGIHEVDFQLDIMDIVKKRLPWLLMNLLTATLASFVIQIFSATIEHIVVLAAIMPIVASMGGNVGTQTMTVSVLGLSSRELTSINAIRIISRQVIACLLNGTIIAIIGGFIIFFWQNNTYLSLVFAISTIINFSLAGFFGSLVPIIIDKMDIDPAVASPIFLTTLTDIIGFFTFLGLASIFLT